MHKDCNIHNQFQMSSVVVKQSAPKTGTKSKPSGETITISFKKSTKRNAAPKKAIKKSKQKKPKATTKPKTKKNKPKQNSPTFVVVPDGTLLTALGYKVVHNKITKQQQPLLIRTVH